MILKSKKRFLIMRSGGIGDIFHIYPILIDLKKNGYKVDLLLFHNAENTFFKNIFKSEYYSKIITLSDGNLSAFKKVIAMKYSNVLILNASNEKRFSVLKKILLSIFSGNFLNIKVLPIQNINSSKKRSQINFKRQRALYEPDLLLNFYNKFYNRNAKRVYDVVSEKINDNTIFDNDFNVFILATNNDVNRLPEKKWLDIALKTSNSVSIVLLGGKSELNYAENVIGFLSDFNIISLVGKISLANSVYVISNALKVYSHDTGLMHIAAAIKSNLTVFFSGRDQLGRWHPTNKESKVIYEYQDCGYCMVNSCPHNKKCLIQSVDKLINLC
jgi:heptosyltransferase-2